MKIKSERMIQAHEKAKDMLLSEGVVSRADLIKILKSNKDIECFLTALEKSTGILLAHAKGYISVAKNTREPPVTRPSMPRPVWSSYCLLSNIETNGIGGSDMIKNGGYRS